MPAGDLAGAGGAATTATVRGASRERRSAVHRLFASGSTAALSTVGSLSPKIECPPACKRSPVSCMQARRSTMC